MSTGAQQVILQIWILSRFGVIPKRLLALMRDWVWDLGREVKVFGVQRGRVAGGTQFRCQ
jgi:hypothetical protein